MKKEDTAKAQKTVADSIWEEIKGVEVPMFALPGKTVAEYCTRVEITPDKVHLKLGVPSLLPMLEASFSKKYDIKMGTMYCEISVKQEEK